MWERMVGLFKRHLATAISGSDPPAIDTLNTTLIMIESVINRRPLTSVTSDSRDPDPLSVDMILNPGTEDWEAEMVVPQNKTSEADVLRFRYKQAIARVKSFKKRFINEYVSTLAVRTKWDASKPNLEEGQLVLLADESRKRSDWALGMVQQTLSSDGHVRTVAIRKADGSIVKRDRSRIVRLEFEREK